MSHRPQPTVPHLPAPPSHPPGFWQREARFAEPLTPFAASWLLPPHNRASKASFAELSAMIDRVELREIGGYVYRHTVFSGPQQAPGPLSRPLARFLLRVRPATRRRLAGALQQMQEDGSRQFLERWQGEWQPKLANERARLDAADLVRLDDRALDAHAEQVLLLALEGSRISALVAAAAWLAVGRFVLNSGRSLSYDEDRSLALVTDTAETNAAVVQTAREGLSESARAGFDEQLSAARRAYAAPAESYRGGVEEPLALGRSAVLEFGRRLMERGQIDGAAAAEFLSIDEARAAMRDWAGRQDAVKGRREAWRSAGERVPPESLGTPPAATPLELYPQAVREMTEALLIGLRQPAP